MGSVDFAGLLDKNRNYLRKTKQSLAAADYAKSFEPETDAAYQKQDGHYLAKRQNIRCFVQSKYSVEEEVKSMFAATPKNAQCIILFGCGLGDAVRYALDSRKFPELNSLIIIEPSTTWASIVMNETDMEKAWGENAGKISFFVGYQPEHISTMVISGTLSAGENFSMAYHLSTRTLFFEYYQELIDKTIDKMRNIPIMLGTNKKLMHRKNYNEILNLSLKSYSFADIMDLFQGKNIIIVSAGPSLQKNIHLLEEAKKKAVVVAVGSAIRILDLQGITPHIRMALDPSPNQHPFFDNLKNESDFVPLIYSNALYTEIARCYKGPRIHADLETNNLSIFLNNKKKRKTMSFPTGPTIANLAAEVFCAAGCKTMVFTGQDMCMYNHRLYAHSNEHLAYKNMDDSRFMLSLKDIYGNEVVAPRNYYMIKERLEITTVQFRSKVNFINATEGGLGLKGVPNKPLAEVLAGWEEDDIAPLITERLKNIELIDFQDELYEFKEKIGDIDRLNDENLKKLQKIKDIFLQDERLLQKEKYVNAFKAAQKNEQKIKKMDWHSAFIQPSLEMFLQAECLRWEKGIDSADEKTRLRSILEIQLNTAQATKSLTIILKKALEAVFASEIKSKTFFLTVK